MSNRKIPKANKYNAKKTDMDGITFDSKKEARRYIELKNLLSAGVISNLKLQPEFPLVVGVTPVKIRSRGYPNGRRVKYVADFQYISTDTGELVVEDVKGMDTSTSRLKRALVEAIYDVQVRVI